MSFSEFEVWLRVVGGFEMRVSCIEYWVIWVFSFGCCLVGFRVVFLSGVSSG